MRGNLLAQEISAKTRTHLVAGGRGLETVNSEVGGKVQNRCHKISKSYSVATG